MGTYKLTPFGGKNLDLQNLKGTKLVALNYKVYSNTLKYFKGPLLIIK